MNPDIRLFTRSVLIAVGIFSPSLITVQPVLANCNDRMGNLEYYQPIMERRWAQLQAQTIYPWGTARVYGTLDKNKIRLTSAFDKLNRQQKRQVIEEIGFDYGENTLRQLPYWFRKLIKSLLVLASSDLREFNLATLDELLNRRGKSWGWIKSRQ